MVHFWLLVVSEPLSALPTRTTPLHPGERVCKFTYVYTYIYKYIYIHIYIDIYTYICRYIYIYT